MLPIGVIVPTRNSMQRLPAHLEAMQPWLDIVEQIVVVDSQSQDGTWEYLKTHLKHPRVQFLDHPPGLYQSWNFGIGKNSAPYTYISTVGDTITREGIEHLCADIQSLQADVILSKPTFTDMQGRPLHVEWPIDDIIKTLKVQNSRLLCPLEAVLFAIFHSSNALLGSCASNLFRTEPLKQRPFPSEYGVTGDGAWGLQYAADILWAVNSQKHSTFLHHPTDASKTEKLTASYDSEKLVQELVQNIQQRHLFPAETLQHGHVLELAALLTPYKKAGRALYERQKGRLPWILNPAAWLFRLRRNQLRRQMRTLLHRGLPEHKT